MIEPVDTIFAQLKSRCREADASCRSVLRCSKRVRPWAKLGADVAGAQALLAKGDGVENGVAHSVSALARRVRVEMFIVVLTDIREDLASAPDRARV